MQRGKKKDKDIQELLKAKQRAHSYCRNHLQGVADNLQKLRKQLKKPKKNESMNHYYPFRWKLGDSSLYRNFGINSKIGRAHV